MNDVGKYIPLKQIVSYFLDQYQKSYSDFDRCWILAFRAMMKMHFDITAEPKTVRLPVNGNKTVTLPTDYLSWSKIGVLDNNGQVSTLKVNKALTKYDDTRDDRISKLTADINDNALGLSNPNYYFNYYYNDSYFNLFGTQTGLIQYGECTVDERNNIILLNPHFKYDQVILEYISSPQRDDDYKVETVLTEPIIAFIEWKLKLGTDKAYYAALITARRSLNNKKVTLQQVNQVIRESVAMKLLS